MLLASSIAKAECIDEVRAIRDSGTGVMDKVAEMHSSIGVECKRSPVYVLELGSYYIQLKNYEKAEIQFRQIIENNPKFVHLGIFGLGNVQLARSDYESASEYYNRLVNRYPGWDKGYEYLGMAYVGQGKYGKAKDILSKGLEVTTTNSEIYRYLGFASYYLDDPKETIRFMDKAFSINRNLILDKKAMIAVIRSNIQLEKFEVAKSLLTILISNVPNLDKDPEYIQAVEYLVKESS